MMVEGGQAEGGETVHTKEMRTEINGGSATDPANFEVTFKHPGKLYVNKLIYLHIYTSIYSLMLQLKHVLQNPEGGDGLPAAEAGGEEFER